MSSNGEMLTNANTDNALSNILSNFNPGYILDIVRDSINTRFRPYSTAMPGMNAIEQNFRNIENSFTDYSQKQKIMETRQRTYNDVINTLCQYYNLTFEPNEDTDIYTVAYFLYDILVANFSATIINFFTNYTLAHRDDIYAAAAEQSKITKEDTSSYSKKIYSDPKLGYIHSNIATIMDNIAVSDIRLADIVQYGNGDQNCFICITNNISENGRLFYEHFAVYLNNPATRADLITNVKLALQKYATADMSIVAPTLDT
jgi:hypothetical protein